MKPRPLAKEIENTLGMKLVLIPRGKFKMGSPSTEAGHNPVEEQHEVEITQPFYTGKFEVTKGEFAEFVRDKGHKTEAEEAGNQFTWRNPRFAQADRHPVVYVSWNDAAAFCKWLSGKEGKRYRLPTEAEWEYNCRAGTTTRFHSGEDEAGLKKVANYSANGPGSTTPVGTLGANAFGLHDLHGNVWEWCQDWYSADYYQKSPRQDPQGAAAGASRVMRGGSFNNAPRFCRAADRYYGEPSPHNDFIGFRVVCVEFPTKRGHGVKLYSVCSYSAGETYPSDECRRLVL